MQAVPYAMQALQAASATVAIGTALKANSMADKTPAQPKTPTLQQAQQQTDTLDRLRSRKGVLANLYAGQAGGTVQTAAKSLLGQ